MTAAPLDLDALEAACEAATEEPLEIVPIEQWSTFHLETASGYVVFQAYFPNAEENAKFLHALWTAAPALFAAARERDALRATRQLENESRDQVVKTWHERWRIYAEESSSLRNALRLAEPIVDLWAAYARRNLEGSEQYAADNALAKARAALGKPSVTENSARPHLPTP